MQDQTLPGQQPGDVRESAPLIVRRDDRDDGPEGIDEAPTSAAWLVINTVEDHREKS
jgi:hypothetical protein